MYCNANTQAIAISSICGERHLDLQATANGELLFYLESQAQAVAPELKPIVPTSIKVERIGFTRNASNTPYIVYHTEKKRCCTFVKRTKFMQLVQVLLKLVKGIDSKIRSLASTPDFGLVMQVAEHREHIPSSYLRKFFSLYNDVALERVTPQQGCQCSRIFSFCQHDIVSAIREVLLSPPASLTSST